MSRWILPLILLATLIIAVEIYSFQAFKTISKSKFVRFGFLAVSIAVYLYFFATMLSYSRSTGQTPKGQLTFGLLLTVLLPKLVIIFVMLGEDVYRLAVKGISAISSTETKSIPGRRKFVSQIALVLAAIPFTSFIYGIIQGKYNYKVLKYQLSFKDLPDAFEWPCSVALLQIGGQNLSQRYNL